MQKTTNYSLNLYDATDDFLRANFNADNMLIDSTLKTIANYRPYVKGTYTGTGTTTQTITLGFRPKAVFMFTQKSELDNGTYSNSGGRFALLLDGTNIMFSTTTMAAVITTGFTVAGVTDSSGNYYTPVLNNAGLIYSYIAFQ